MDFLELAKLRYSSRKYSEKKIEEKKLNKLIEAGRIAPSAVNKQPWHIIVIQEEEELNTIKECYHRDWIKTAPLVLAICGDHDEAWHRQDGKDHCDIDISIITDHITLQATELGLASCWVCNFEPEKTKEVLKLPKNIEPIVLLPIGYPEDAPKENRHDKLRKNQNEFVHFGKFGNKK